MLIKKSSKMKLGKTLTLYVRGRDSDNLDALQPYLKEAGVSLSSLIAAFVARLVLERPSGRDDLDRMLEQLGVEL